MDDYIFWCELTDKELEEAVKWCADELEYYTPLYHKSTDRGTEKKRHCFGFYSSEARLAFKLRWS